MDKNEFEIWINSFDQQCSDRGGPVWARSLLAWFEITNYQLEAPREDYNSDIGPYEGSNLMLSIEDWYRQRYPVEALSPEGWGSRLMLIRGVVFQLKMPLIFNAKLPLDPFEYCGNLNIDLRNSLSKSEVEGVINSFTLYYEEASAIVKTIVELRSNRPTLACQLFEAAWSDLRAISGAYRPSDHTAMLFLTHQAVEKCLKSRIALNEPGITDSQIRKMYGHNLTKLSIACGVIDQYLKSVKPMCELFDFGQEVRYLRPDKNLEDTLALVNHAHNITAAVAVSIRRSLSSLRT